MVQKGILAQGLAILAALAFSPSLRKEFASTV